MLDETFGLVDPFDIDLGELDGLSQQMAFALGAEWQIVRQLLESGGPIRLMIHSENRARIESMIQRRGRECRITAMHDDVSESWLILSVG